MRPSSILPPLPNVTLLGEWVPSAVWETARREAQRSPLRTYGMGAALFDPASGRLLSRGCSHQHEGRRAMASTHAEQHALARARHVALSGAWCVVCVLNRSRTAHSVSARPCAACARALAHAGVQRVVYCERTRIGFKVSCVDCVDLAALAPASTRYARCMRVPLPA